MFSEYSYSGPANYLAGNRHDDEAMESSAQEKPMHRQQQPSPLLHRSMIADATISGATGLMLMAGAGMLTTLLGMPESLMRYAGLILLPFAAMVFYWSNPARLSRPRVWTIIALNIAWVVASVLLLAAGWTEPTALGVAFVLFQAVVVAVFAELQYAGLKSLNATGG